MSAGTGSRLELRVLIEGPGLSVDVEHCTQVTASGGS
jgi:hypothetical protein